MAVEVFCKAEGRAIGVLLAPKGAVLDAKRFVQSFRPVNPAYSFAGVNVENHTQLTCPRCHNPLLFKQPPEDGRGNPTGVYAVLGNVKAA